MSLEELQELRDTGSITNTQYHDIKDLLTGKENGMRTYYCINCGRSLSRLLTYKKGDELCCTFCDNTVLTTNDYIRYLHERLDFIEHSQAENQKQLDALLQDVILLDKTKKNK